MRDEGLVLELVLYGELIHPSLVTRPLLVPADDDEDAGEPVRDQDEAGHQQAQDDGAVLGKSDHTLEMLIILTEVDLSIF